jgi:hypothetical protein
VDDQSLSICEDVPLIEVAPKNCLAATVPTPTDMKLKLPMLSHLVVGVEGTHEHLWLSAAATDSSFLFHHRFIG